MWSELLGAYRDLVSALDGGDRLVPCWSKFREIAQSGEQHPPYHLAGLQHALEWHRGTRPREEDATLDHGCGGGMTLLYLAAIGYTRIHGVDIGDSNCERWNRFTREIIAAPEQRFFRYDGRVLPFPENSMDIVFSQQVLEHVRPDALDDYYAEEHRVLRPGGLAVHAVPHRLVPYDSRTRTWFLHWVLPRGAWLRTLRLLGHSVETAEKALYLRWPWTHRRLGRGHFGHVEDRTRDRLCDSTAFEYYDGPAGMRRQAGRVVRLPVVGGVAARALSLFIMMDTVSCNRK